MHSEGLFRSARCSTISVHEYDRQTVAAECVSQRTSVGLRLPQQDGRCGLPTMTFCRSIAIRAVVVSSFVSGIVFSSGCYFFCRQAHDDLARLKEGFPFLFIQLPGWPPPATPASHPWRFRMAVPLAVERDIHLAAICRMRFAFDEAHFLKCRNGGSHRLWFDTFRRAIAISAVVAGPSLARRAYDE